MPIYEYQCQLCNHQFDLLQKISEKPVQICPACSKNSVERLISASGFQLKGSGWYATDFKTKPKKEVAAGEAKSGKKYEAKPTNSDSKAVDKKNSLVKKESAD